MSGDLRDIGIIGDRRTVALVTRKGDVVWYAPGRFDRPSLFGALLDPGAGAWRLEAPGGTVLRRAYLEDSGVLRTDFRQEGGDWSLTDWMAAGPDAPAGVLVRRLSPSGGPRRFVIEPRPDYARQVPELRRDGDVVDVAGRWRLHSSHAPEIEGSTIRIDVPPGEPAWVALCDGPVPDPGPELLDRWQAATLAHWRSTAGHATYHGPFEREVAASLRALRLLTSESSGGVIAAATTSLPEVPGGHRNWDYRYVWLRDTGMIVSALTRAGSDGTEGWRFLDFVCRSYGYGEGLPIPSFLTLDGEPAPPEFELDWQGWEGSRPVRVGNGARNQLQLDAYGNVLLAAKLLYGKSDSREHWDTISALADFVADHWREPDHGLWEEAARLQYTVGKVIACVGLRFIADLGDDPDRVRRWRSAAADIARFVEAECRRPSDGAYVSFAGSDHVDISAALFPVWAYGDADSPQMRATIAAIERELSAGGLLYRRRLECDDARREGAFLAGSFWVAQYWIMRGDLERARRIMDAALAFANDLGLLPEEGDPATGRPLGNLPQAFVHASLVGCAVDLRAAMDGGE